MKGSFDRLLNEPYRLYFPLGILMALGGVGHWLFYALGWMTWYSGFLHANIQVQLYLPCFIGGFLMTAVPRFSDTWPARRWELVGSLGLLTGIALMLFLGNWVLSEVFYALWLIFLMRFIVVRFLRRRVEYPPTEFVWIPPALFLGLAGAVLIVLVLTGHLSAGWMAVGRSMQEQGFALALVVGIGGFLGPRLMGGHQLSQVSFQNLRIEVRKKIIIHASAAFLLVLSFFLEGSEEAFVAYALRAAVVTGMFLWSRSLNTKIISGPSLFVRLLSASFWMIAIGYWLIPLFPKLHVPLLHLVFLGGFSVMIHCISTMVVLNHSGRGDLLHRPLWIFWLMGLFVFTSLGIRVAATFFGTHYFLLLGISASLWLLAGIGWLLFSFPYIFHAPKKASDPAGHAC
jgi:uncharacterized protein involved in response to NO